MHDCNRDESAVPPFALPNPLRFESGRPLSDSSQWPQRRSELLELFASHVYGRAPASAQRVSVVATLCDEWLCDVAIAPGVSRPLLVQHRELRLHGNSLASPPAPADGSAPPAASPAPPQQPRSYSRPIALTTWRPAAAQEPAPLFLNLNFLGNHGVTSDPRVPLATSWARPDTPGVVDNRFTEASRASESRRYPIPTILQAGWALATLYHGDLEPDHPDGWRDGIRGWLDEPGPRPPDNWGALGAWAWGLSRALDVLRSEPAFRGAPIVALGHSRLGKAALWAAAQDARFAGVASNNSGCGGAALSRRWFGETVARINEQFPHWFAPAFHAYGADPSRLRVDQHQLLALLAPRPLHVASASEDWWADPRGEFLSLREAAQVYRFLGADALPPDAPHPQPDSTVIQGRTAYHLRRGSHDLTPADWSHYLAFFSNAFLPRSQEPN